MLAECPELQDLKITDDAIQKFLAPDTYMRALHLPHLRSVAIYGSNHHISEILLALDAPVESLVVTPIVFEDLDVLEAMLPSEPSVTKTIKHFTISMLDDELNAFLILTRCFPLVENLVLANFHRERASASFLYAEDVPWPMSHPRLG